MVKKWTEIGGGNFPPAHDFKKDKEVEGVLKEVNTFKDKESGRDRKAYVLTTDHGDVNVYGCGQLDYKMASVEVGQEIKIEYLGKEKVTIKGKKREVNQFKVYGLE